MKQHQKLEIKDLEGNTIAIKNLKNTIIEVTSAVHFLKNKKNLKDPSSLKKWEYVLNELKKLETKIKST